MRDVTGYDAWYNETIRCLTSDDGNRIAIKHSGGWFLALAFPGSRRTTLTVPWTWHLGIIPVGAPAARQNLG